MIFQACLRGETEICGGQVLSISLVVIGAVSIVIGLVVHFVVEFSDRRYRAKLKLKENHTKQELEQQLKRFESSGIISKKNVVQLHKLFQSSHLVQVTFRVLFIFQSQNFLQSPNIIIVSRSADQVFKL